MRETTLLANMEEIEKLGENSQPLDGREDDAGGVNVAVALEVNSSNDGSGFGSRAAAAWRVQEISVSAISGSEKAFLGWKKSAECFIRCCD